MLISFSVSNYRSFGEEVTLNMVASNKITDHPTHRVPIGETGKHVLRAAVIYGANAAGKSNLIRAMAVAQRLIRQRGESLEPVEPFRFQPNAAGKPSSFEFRFLLDDRVFVYGFDILANQFQTEWLYVVNGSGEVRIFERDKLGRTDVIPDTRRLFPTDDKISDALGILKRLPLRPDQLFLNRVSSLPEEAQGPTLASILRWLTQDLMVLSVGPRISSNIVERLHDDEKFRHFCSQFLKNVGTGIGGLDVREFERDTSDWERHIVEQFGERARQFLQGNADHTDVRPKPGDPGRLIGRQLLARHPRKAAEFELPFGEESDGTQQLLQFLPILAPHSDESRVVVIDELDRSLHPLLGWEFLRFFSESCPGARKQLIVTTHEAHLLNQELLRRDEYWFVEKDADQQSRLVSLSDFNIRNDLQIEKGYLQGRFGAIPVIGAMDELKKLLECPCPEDADAAQVAPA